MMRNKKRAISNFFILLVLVAGISWVCGKFIHLGNVEYTDNAQVKQHLTPVSTRVQGFIKKICFEEYQTVKKGVPFSYHSFNRGLNRPVLLKNPGEKRDIFCKNCFLECNAGSGYHDRTLLIRGTSFCKEGIFSHQNTGHQIGIRLADTDTRVTQCYVSSQQVIQHFVA